MTNTLVRSPSRSVSHIVRGQLVNDGAGVRLNRIIGQREFDMLDPFLLLDEFRFESTQTTIGQAFRITRIVASKPSPTCSLAACVITTTRVTMACCFRAVCSG